MLPQLGFGHDCDFASLVQSNRFLFRVYTPKQDDNSADGAFVATKFNKKHNRSPCELPESSDCSLPAVPALKDIASYRDAVVHFDWTTRKQSPFVLTSFSFAWAIWEALRRYRESVKHDVHIAIIDAMALQDRSLTALQLLKSASSEEYVHFPVTTVSLLISRLGVTKTIGAGADLDESRKLFSFMAASLKVPSSPPSP